MKNWYMLQHGWIWKHYAKVSVPKIHKNKELEEHRSRCEGPKHSLFAKTSNDSFSVSINMLSGGDGMVKAKRKDS